MTGLPAVAVGMTGLAVGVAAGFAVQRARLCTFGAVEDALVGGNWRRMKAFGLALGIAILGTQALIAFAGFDPATSTYIPARFALVGAFIGASLFGLGMALVGTCAFGSLIRLGTGDLRALVTLMIFGTVAYAALRGVLSGPRIDVVERLAVPMPHGAAGSIPSILAAGTGWSLALPIALAVSLALLLVAIRDERLRHSPRLVAAALILGLGTVIGWAVTGLLADPFGDYIRVQSLTFVAPVARALYGLTAGDGSLFDFGVMSVFGVIVGAAAGALRSREFRWEAFDDQREMRRHLLGAVLMGLGGVLAGGCTIGQGLTAGSLLAISWPVTVGGMVLGARIGIAILLDDSLGEWLRAVFGRARSRREPAE